MNHLFRILADRTREWQERDYYCEPFPAISEILRYQFIDDGTKKDLRFLRPPQFRALEVYWYLRLMEKTPHIFELYNNAFKKQSELLTVLGLAHSSIKEYVLDEGMESLWERIKTDDQFVKDFKLEALRETLCLDYPSYILALAMGAGKTILIGAIIATEFAMALEYPTSKGNLADAFVENALVFAPGKTIIESLRELAETSYDKILPPRLYKDFAASIKLTFTPDGAKDIPVVRESSFNVVVTNTEKIRIQKPTVRAAKGWTQQHLEEVVKQQTEDANLRLQTIASLPHLAVFSDEAHHTYGQAMGTDLKKVRQTVDYLHRNTNLICVINTTGTPYYERQPLKDVVTWYGLSEGIDDHILKEVSGNILSYSFDADNTDTFVNEVVNDFFRDYADVTLPNGAPAKLAIYFPQNNDLKELRPVIEKALVEAGQSTAIVLKNTSESDKVEIDAFNRLNDPGSPHRVILLVNKGTEGWNCPSLFACALARKLKSSNNFILQAATRCLRQIPGNNTKARIYLSKDNRAILDRQLQETYGESIADLDHAGSETLSVTLTLRKSDLPRLVITQTVRTVTRKEGTTSTAISLVKPTKDGANAMILERLRITGQYASSSVLQQVGDSITIEAAPETHDLHSAAVNLSEWYRLKLWPIFDELKRLYGEVGEVPLAHFPELARQIEQQTSFYEVKESKVDVALALVKPEGFDSATDSDGKTVYTAEIRIAKEKEHLLVHNDKSELSFHYTPYNFDSNPEKSFLMDRLLPYIKEKPEDVAGIYFTGGITSPSKTDFFVEYKDEKGHWRNYFPDFIIHIKGKGTGKKKDRFLIVEIKREHDRQHPIDGEEGKKLMAVRKWENLNPDRLKYQIIFTDSDDVPQDQVALVKKYIREANV